MADEKKKAWQEFAKTGDPSYYMLYKTLEKLEKKEFD